MLDQSLRNTILTLKRKAWSIRQIARELRISRRTVKKVLRTGSASPPSILRAEKAEPYRDEILELYPYCKGNLVRVHEELLARGAEFSYQALTAFCRRQDIGHEPPRPSGRYHFEPGQEMQHDTSPHYALITDKPVKVQTASLVLCYSRMLYFQCYPTFNRFYCKLFLTGALKCLQGACATCMVDNTSVVVGSGTGADMVPAAEMEAFARRFDFEFRAHEKGDANRSARVERPMDFIENNFFAGRKFTDFSDLNRRALEFSDKTNASYKRHLGARPQELFAVEAAYLKPLPLYIPEVYQLHHRIVDIEGYVTVARHRYSAPWKLIGKRLEVRESEERVDLYDGPRRVGSHPKTWSNLPTRNLLPEHRPPRGEGVWTKRVSPEEQELLALGEPLTDYIEALKKRSPGRGTMALRRLVGLLHDYPRPAFLHALRTAAEYGLYDLERVERLILRAIAGEYFLLRPSDDDHD